MNKKGFTLVELLIVVAIIGIIAAIAIPNLMVALQKGKQKATMGDLKTVGGAIESYVTDWSQVPVIANLAALNTATWFVPFYIKVVPTTDGWGSVIQFTGNADQYSLMSWGRDRTVSGPTVGQYEVTNITDFNNDIIFANGMFVLGPNVKR